MLTTEEKNMVKETIYNEHIARLQYRKAQLEENILEQQSMLAEVEKKLKELE